MNAYLQALTDLDFLSAEALESQTALLQAVTQTTCQPGEALFHDNDESDCLYLVASGLVKMMTQLPNGRSRIVRLHRRGALLGLNALLEKAHDHTAIAIDEVEVYLLPLAEIMQWKETQPDLYTHLMEKWYDYLNYADTLITDFSTGSVKGRVARLINFLARFDEATGPKVVELLTTDEMAEILGVTPESVSRVVAELKRENILRAIENNVESLFTFDKDSLQELAQS